MMEHLNKPENERTLTSLTLDVIQRLAILEQSFKYADIQRGEIARKVDRLGEIAAAKEDMQIMGRLVEEHERFFNEFKFGLKIARAGWAAVYIAGGTAFGAFLQWVMVNH